MVASLPLKFERVQQISQIFICLSDSNLNIHRFVLARSPGKCMDDQRLNSEVICQISLQFKPTPTTFAPAPAGFRNIFFRQAFACLKVIVPMAAVRRDSFLKSIRNEPTGSSTGYKLFN